MSSAATVLLSLVVALLSGTMAAVVSALFHRRSEVDNRLWSARVSAYSRLIGKLLTWDAPAPLSPAQIRSGTARPPTDIDQVRSEISEALLLASGSLRSLLEDFARISSEESDTLGEINEWFKSNRQASDVDFESVPVWRRLDELDLRERTLREQIISGMRRELRTDGRPTRKGSIGGGDQTSGVSGSSRHAARESDSGQPRCAE